VEPKPAKFRSKGVRVIKRKWPAPESELRSFENLAPEQEPEPLKFIRPHQPCCNNVIEAFQCSVPYIMK